MMRRFSVILQFILLSICFADLSVEEKDKFLNGFVDFLNSSPKPLYAIEDGVVTNVITTDQNCYKIEVRLRVSDVANLDSTKYINCSASLVANTDSITILNNEYECHNEKDSVPNVGNEDLEQTVTDTLGVTEDVVERKPIQLDNEVQPTNAATSGEQFIAVPRDHPPCIGCASEVNPQAAGVTELGNLGIRQLDRHEPNVRHTLNTVHVVERQVQVVNGVRYILTLTVNCNNCTSTETEICTYQKPCKITVLEKPWVKLPSGSKYRAILANNCTEEWQFGDNGEVVDANKESNEINVNPFNDDNIKTDSNNADHDKTSTIDTDDGSLKVSHSYDVQALPNKEQVFTDEEMKNLEEQIIPHKQIYHAPTITDDTTDNVSQSQSDIKVEQVVKLETVNPGGERSIPDVKPEGQENPNSLTKDRKKAIDDLINFFNFAAFDGKDHDIEERIRMKRSYQSDLEIMSLAEKFHKLKKNMNNVKYLFTLGQIMVDYLNEMDMEVKTRTLDNILAAEEEFEGHHRFFYIQARVIIPCDKAECESKDNEIKICNGIIDSSDQKSQEVLSSFCYDEEKKRPTLGKVSGVSVNDPILVTLTNQAVKKMESDKPYPYAMKVDKILDAKTQRVSGTLTKISVSLVFTNCNQSVAMARRMNCTILEHLGSKVCEAEIHERKWLQEKKITYTCTDRPAEETFVNIKGKSVKGNINDPKITEIVQEALQHLEVQSNRNNKQKLVGVKSVSTQVVAGLLTNVDFVVGYTDCTNDYAVDINICELLAEEPLRNCRAQVWERPWLEDGRQVNVTCETTESNVIVRKKRSTSHYVGGTEEKDVTKPKYTKLAEESLQKYYKTSGSTQYLKIIQVNKVTTQVVSGSLTKIEFTVSPTNCELDSNGKASSDTCEVQNTNLITCKASIWERPWLKSKEIEVDCKINEGKSRSKRQLGKGRVQDPSDPKYQKLAEESIAKYDETSGTTEPHTITEIQKVVTKVVAGTQTSIDFKIVSKSNAANVITCHSEIWERPWLKSKEINVTCENNKEKSRIKRNAIEAGIINDESKLAFSNRVSKRAIADLRSSGHRQEKDPSKPEFRSLAEESLRKYQSIQKSQYHHEVLHVERVVTQIVSGRKYDIDFIAAPTKCLIDEVHKKMCEQTKTRLYCHAEIWNRAWLKRKDIKVHCNAEVENDSKEEDNEITHKNSINPVQEKDSERYQLLTEEALNKYQTVKNTKYLHKIVKIERVNEQVVAGFNTNIDFLISPTNCLLSESRVNRKICKLQNLKIRCHAKIIERPMAKKDITVNCQSKNKKYNGKPDIDLELLKARVKRQTLHEDDEVEEETAYYYAERAISAYNENSQTENLFKLVTIHDIQRSEHMNTLMIRMYIDISMTYCLRHEDDIRLPECEEIEGMKHKLCLAKLYPSSDDELIVQQVYIICDTDDNFAAVTGISKPEFIKAAVAKLEKSPEVIYKLYPHGEVQLIPSLKSENPVTMQFLVARTNCSKKIDDKLILRMCSAFTQKPSKTCRAYLWLVPNTRSIRRVEAKCSEKPERTRRSISLEPTNTTAENVMIQKLVQESLEKLEMTSLHRYKQRVLQINSYSSKITAGKLTTIDFDVGYTSCLKYEWVENVTSCMFLEHLPRRHCVSQIWERLWVDNGKNIEVTCEDDETPLESHIEFDSAENAMQLANVALKHIEFKYPHPRKQKVVRIFSLEKQSVAGLHYRMKVEVGLTDCMALSVKHDCKLVTDLGLNKFCRVNVWMRPWTDHPPAFRVACDYQDGATEEVYHYIQAEQLFYDFITTHKPAYINDHVEMGKRFKIFKSNVRRIHELNVYERGTARYAVTRFADLSTEEFRSRYLGLRPSLRDTNQVPMRMAAIPQVELPDKFDWRDHGAVTEVKDQGSCGSCWAFSVTGNIEGQWKLHSGKLLSLSEQELVDCDKLDEGCNGGLPDNAYRAIEQLGGLELESEYPYEGEDDKCAFNKSMSRVQINGAVNITSNETQMAQWLVKNGPISIGINANAMQFYVGGVSHPWKMLCNPKNLDHGVLIVGFGEKDYPLFHKRLPYWTVKNSWGELWGERGYYRVYRGDGTCGVNTMASSAVVTSAQPLNDY